MLLREGGVTISTEKIWEELSHQIGAFIRRRVRDDEFADDLLQQTFVRVHNGLDGLEDERRIKPWVCLQ